MRMFILVGLVLFYSYARAEFISPENAEKFLKSQQCEFSAFSVYNGPSVKSQLGEVKSGQAMSIAICVSSYEEKAATGHKFCWFRPLNIKLGKFIGLQGRNHEFREENVSCSKEVILKILKKPAALADLKLRAQREDWKVVEDKFGVAREFADLLKKPSVAKLKQGKYAKYRWAYFEASNSCGEEPGEADRDSSWYSNQIRDQSEARLIIQPKQNPIARYYYTTKEACESDDRAK